MSPTFWITHESVSVMMVLLLVYMRSHCWIDGDIIGSVDDPNWIIYKAHILLVIDSGGQFNSKCRLSYYKGTLEFHCKQSYLRYTSICANHLKDGIFVTELRGPNLCYKLDSPPSFHSTAPKAKLKVEWKKIYSMWLHWEEGQKTLEMRQVCLHSPEGRSKIKWSAKDLHS